MGPTDLLIQKGLTDRLRYLKFHSQNFPMRSRDRQTMQGVQTTLRVGRWHVDAATDSIALEGTVKKLEPRTMRLLLVLGSQPGKVFSSEELLDSVWPGVVVTGQSLYQAIGELRAALRADTQFAEYVATVPRKGYRLVVPVSQTSDGPSSVGLAESPSETGALQSIALLPFQANGLGPEMSFVRETLLSGLIVELSRQPGLAPIARGTMLSFAGSQASARQVAGELNVRYVLDGSVTQIGDRLHLSWELVDGSSAQVLATEALQIDGAEWPTLVLQVIGRLARVARLHLSEHASRNPSGEGRPNDLALQLATRAWVELYCRPQSRITNERAWRFAEDALEQDPVVGGAWNALAYCHWRAAQFAWSPRPWASLLADALAHAERAVTLSPFDPDAFYTHGLASYTSGEFERAEASLRHCIEISASYAPAYPILGLVRATRGAPEETAALCAKAFALSPREPLRAAWHWAEACGASMLGQEQQALERACLGISANPDHPACYLIAAAASWRIGMIEQARRYIQVLGRTSFSTVARLRTTIPVFRTGTWAAGILDDLGAAGLPAA
jgi:DNA-binding winged helix-turn-helix (wHTH) protein/tetratricopeptide (TPR) repeat protein